MYTGKRIKKKAKFTRWVTLWVILSLLMVLSISGVVLARYVSTNRSWAQMLSSDFHISSNYLKTQDTSYTVANWGNDGITFEIYNYQTENIAQVAGSPIQYTIDVTGSANWTVTVTQNNTTVTADENGRYTLPGNGNAETVQTVHLTSNTGVSSDTVQVSVNTVSPYRYALEATFHLVGQKLPDYTLTDMGNYVLVTLHSNDFSDPILVSWNADFSPDNGNIHMSNWQDTPQPVSMPLNPNTTYELIFVKNKQTPVTATTVTNTNAITIGG